MKCADTRLRGRDCGPATHAHRGRRVCAECAADIDRGIDRQVRQLEADRPRPHPGTQWEGR